MKIRLATADDAQAISQLASEFHAYLNTIGDQTNFYFNADTYRRDGFGDNPAFIGLVAESNDEVIGYLLFHFGYDTDHSRRLAYVIDLYVNEKSRGQGVGKALMQHAADAARAYGAKALWWGVYESNDSAMRFYEGLGAKNVTGVRFMSINVEKLTS